jgi:hypothetical protein
VTQAPPWTALPAQAEAPAPTIDPDALALGKLLATFIAMGATLDDRSRQVEIGSSEVGWPCDRRVVYKISGVAPANPDGDPLRRLIGTGVHLALAGVFRLLDSGHGFFLVEFPVRYRDIPGTADLVFRHGNVVIDWKTAKKEKITRIKREGPPRHYVVQAMLYAAALRAMGYQITHVAIAWLPIDIDHTEGLDKLYVWRAPFNQALADDAVDRIERLSGKRPSQVDPRPDRLCRFCAHYDPNSTNLDAACPGDAKTGDKK